MILLTVTNKSNTWLVGKFLITKRAIWIIITILKPLKITLNYALRRETGFIKNRNFETQDEVNCLLWDAFGPCSVHKRWLDAQSRIGSSLFSLDIYKVPLWRVNFGISLILRNVKFLYLSFCYFLSWWRVSDWEAEVKSKTIPQNVKSFKPKCVKKSKMKLIKYR